MRIGSDYRSKDEDEVTLFSALLLVAATTYSSVVDTDCGTARLTLAATAPAAGTCDVTLETSHNNNDWTTAILSFTQVTTTNASERKRVSGLDRYVRAKAVQAALAVAAWTQPATGSPPAVGSTGTVAVAGTYEIKITTGGARGTAEFSYRVNGGAWSTPAATAATAALGSTGLTATFATGTDYTLGHVYSTTAAGYTLTLSGELV